MRGAKVKDACCRFNQRRFAMKCPTCQHDNRAEAKFCEECAAPMNAHDAVPVFNATALIFVYKAKTHAALPELVEWAKRYERALAVATHEVDEFTAELFTSRFYRGTGFLPQRRNHRSEVVRTMDLAERHAFNMKPTTPAQELLYRENLHALMESRTKEALWLDDKDQALARALKVIEVDPYDAKAWVELGEVRYFRTEWQEAARAYIAAATLGPPASVVARYMAGVCFRELGQNLLAALFLKDTLELPSASHRARRFVISPTSES
jgi:tetratricopeptide (TPR) repeat protein